MYGDRYYWSDHCGRTGADQLKERLIEYWHRQGAEVEFSIEYLESGRNTPAGIWCIRSNLVGGLPRKEPAEAR